MGFDGRRQPAQHQTVNHHHLTVGDSRERGSYGLPGDGIGIGKAAGQLVDVDCESRRAQAVDDPAVIPTAPGGAVQ